MNPNIVKSSVQNQGPANPFKQNPNAYQDMRNKAQQDAGNEQSQSMDALTRRFAAQGGLNSGAYIQAQQNVGRDAAQQAQDQIGKINMQEQSVADQGMMQHNQLQEQNNEFTQSQGQQEAQFENELPLKSRQLDLESNQQGMDAAANAFNEQLAGFQANHSGGMFGQGGPLGLGNGLGGSGPLDTFKL